MLTRADNYPDALAGVPLAAKVGGPLLLTSSAALNPSVGAEIVRVLPAGGTVYILGGTAAVGAAVVTTLTDDHFVVKRLAGSDRFATAVTIADALGDPTTVFEATGLNFPDALAGGPAAIMSGAAILLTNGSTQAPATAAYLAAHTGGTHYALGGPAAAADPGATSIVGTDRYATAARVADTFFTAPTVGRGRNWGQLPRRARGWARPRLEAGAAAPRAAGRRAARGLDARTGLGQPDRAQRVRLRRHPVDLRRRRDASRRSGESRGNGRYRIDVRSI